MITTSEAKKAIGIMKVNGLTSAPEGRIAIDVVAATWVAVFDDMDAMGLEHAVYSYLRNDESGRWPTPAALRKHLPGQLAAQVDIADEAWGELIRGASHYGTAPGAFVNATLAGNDPSHPYYGVRWDWSGDDDTRAIKQQALDDIGGWAHFNRGETWANNGAEGQLRHSFRNALRSRQTRLRIAREEGNVVHLLSSAGGRMQGITDKGDQ